MMLNKKIINETNENKICYIWHIAHKVLFCFINRAKGIVFVGVLETKKEKNNYIG